MDLSLWTVLAEGEPQAAPNTWWLPLLLVAVIFYFIVIRPSSRERKSREAQLAALKKHDRVLTYAGIYGTVVDIQGDVLTLRVDDKNNVRLRFSRAAVSQVLQPEDEGASKATEGKGS